jgi:MATE family multidrug resistance protein
MQRGIESIRGAGDQHLDLPFRGQVKEVWSLAWPTVITMTSYTVMSFVDGLMVAQVDPVQVAAQGNGGLWSFNVIAFAFGILTVVNTYVSQHLGAGRPERAPAYAWASIWLSLLMWLGLMLPYALLLPLIFAQMNHSPEVVRMESGYAQILIAGSLVLMICKGVQNYFFGLHRPKIITLSALVGNVVNIAANYVFIFGENGVPALGLPGVPGVLALGLYGAAIGTVIGTTVECLIPIAIFLGPKMNAQLNTRAQWRPDWKPIKALIKIGWPAAVQFSNEVMCWSIFMAVLVGQFGDDHMTAGWAALRYMHLSFMPAIGFSVATTSLVGRYIGAGKPDIAARRARLSLSLAMSYMTLCAIIFFVFRRELISVFVTGQSVDPVRAANLIEIGAKLMICAAVFQTVDAFGIIYTGALRGAGDTVWPGVATIIYSWLFIVGLGWLMVEYFPQLESVGPWIGAAVFITFYGVTMALRFERGRWRSIALMEAPLRSQEAMRQEVATHTAAPADASPMMAGVPVPVDGVSKPKEAVSAGPQGR